MLFRSPLFAGSFGKFVVVGTIGFVINTVILEALVAFGFHPVVGSVVGAEVTIISNFFFNNAWTFRERKIGGKRRTAAKFVQFNISSIGAVVIQATTIWIGSYLFGVSSYRLFYILGTIVGIAWNYMMYSKVIWKK